MLESFHAQYMLALYRSGRQWRALQAYREIRNTIADQLGIEPSPRLQRLHHAILRGESEVDDPNFLSSRWIPARAPEEQSPARPNIATVS
jgi:DNA-binding SARP family transcriptional activator